MREGWEVMSTQFSCYPPTKSLPRSLRVTLLTTNQKEKASSVPCTCLLGLFSE
jgi:hypothetical protein